MGEAGEVARRIDDELLTMTLDQWRRRLAIVRHSRQVVAAETQRVRSFIPHAQVGEEKPHPHTSFRRDDSDARYMQAAVKIASALCIRSMTFAIWPFAEK